MSGLKIGARGDAVKQLQQQLIAAGFPMVGGADGVFGALTANALGSFQQSNGSAGDAVSPTTQRWRHWPKRPTAARRPRLPPLPCSVSRSALRAMP